MLSKIIKDIFSPAKAIKVIKPRELIAVYTLNSFMKNEAGFPILEESEINKLIDKMHKSDEYDLSDFTIRNTVWGSKCEEIKEELYVLCSMNYAYKDNGKIFVNIEGIKYFIEIFSKFSTREKDWKEIISFLLNKD